LLDYSQIEALLAVEDQGSFEGAARSLRITAFAITQRIKLLEKSLGVALIERKPTRTSNAGKILCTHAREVLNLETEVLEQNQLIETELEADHQVLKIALNDEILSGWFSEVLKDQSKRENGFHLDVTLTNCDRAIDLMQKGNVVAAVSTRKEPVHGFKSYSLDSAIYLPVASPEFIASHFQHGVTKASLEKAPCLRYCNNDSCAKEWTRQVYGEVLQLTFFNHPSTTSLIKNCLKHHAWTLAPAGFIDVHLQSGSLVELIPNQPLKRTLYWHVSGAIVDDVMHITKAIRNASKTK